MYRVLEFGEVLADACLRDTGGRVLFLSVYGRDGALMQFLSALSLPVHQQGLSHFHLVDAEGRQHFCDVAGADRLTKHSGRLPKHNLFGPLAQMWIYDKALQAPDRVNRIGWVLKHVQGQGSDAAQAQARCLQTLMDAGWQLMQRLSPVALLDTWRPPLMQWAAEAGVLRKLDDPQFLPLGPVRGLRIGLGQGFVPKVSELVRQGTLQLSDSPVPVFSRDDSRAEMPLTA